MARAHAEQLLRRYGAALRPLIPATTTVDMPAPAE
jgi:hypothetical protein